MPAQSIAAGKVASFASGAYARVRQQFKMSIGKFEGIEEPLARIGAATASQAGMIGPVSTLFLGALILNEPITNWQLAGTGLVLSGIYMLSKK